MPETAYDHVNTPPAVSRPPIAFGAKPAYQTAHRAGNLFVREDLSKFSADRSRAEIVVESSNQDFPRAIEELSGTTAKNLAQAYAAMNGVSDPRINGLATHAYPVNADGVPLEEVKAPDGQSPLAPTDHKMQPAAYRANVPITRRPI